MTVRDSLPEVLEKLEPCPFCGREATVENPEEGCYAIGCDDCCFSVMAGNVGIGWYATRAEAITAWNTRHALLRDAGDGDAKDAARYRWLRDPKNFESVQSMIAVTNYGLDPYLLDGDELDAAIDAAMHAPGGATGEQ